MSRNVTLWPRTCVNHTALSGDPCVFPVSLICVMVSIYKKSEEDGILKESVLIINGGKEGGLFSLLLDLWMNNFLTTTGLTVYPTLLQPSYSWGGVLPATSTSDLK